MFRYVPNCQQIYLRLLNTLTPIHVWIFCSISKSKIRSRLDEAKYTVGSRFMVILHQLAPTCIMHMQFMLLSQLGQCLLFVFFCLQILSLNIIKLKTMNISHDFSFMNSSLQKLVARGSLFILNARSHFFSYNSNQRKSHWEIQQTR